MPAPFEHDTSRPAASFRGHTDFAPRSPVDEPARQTMRPSMVGKRVEYWSCWPTSCPKIGELSSADEDEKSTSSRTVPPARAARKPRRDHLHSSPRRSDAMFCVARGWELQGSAALNTPQIGGAPRTRRFSRHPSSSPLSLHQSPPFRLPLQVTLKPQPPRRAARRGRQDQDRCQYRTLPRAFSPRGADVGALLHEPSRNGKTNSAKSPVRDKCRLPRRKLVGPLARRTTTLKASHITLPTAESDLIFRGACRHSAINCSTACLNCVSRARSTNPGPRLQHSRQKGSAPGPTGQHSRENHNCPRRRRLALRVLPANLAAVRFRHPTAHAKGGANYPNPIRKGRSIGNRSVASILQR